MERYRSIFNESIDIVDENELEKIVDISNLQWASKTVKRNWRDATSKCPSGWRLPTIQELHTAYVKKVEGFKLDKGYLSSSTSNPSWNGKLVMDWDDGRISSSGHNSPFMFVT